MPAKATFARYVKEAFNARPLGMFVAPNWIGLAVCGLLGLLNSGVWILGAAAELFYLYILSCNKRFQHWVDAKVLAQDEQTALDRIRGLLAKIPQSDQSRYQALVSKCQAILTHLNERHTEADFNLQTQALARLTWIYLQLLIMRDSLRRSLRLATESESGGQPGSSKALKSSGVSPSDSAAPIQERIENLQKRLQQPDTTEDLRKSLAAQLQILAQRLKTQEEAHQRIAFADAELIRIQEQIELIRDQTFLSVEPSTLTERIDQAAAGLESAVGWIGEQQRLYGKIEELTLDSPDVLVAPAKIAQ